ncbi:MAG: hypothetical protein KHZ87_07075 [Clostridiales bacterium]|nr:hypothetical protein [Clostridiales bacterium]MBS5878427.1 hypothetical protein [Clostridiales bacterium]
MSLPYRNDQSQGANGVAVYVNNASGPDTAGDDVVKVKYEHATTQGTLTLADRMLGGGAVKWYKDGGIEGSVVGSVDSKVPRFDPAAPGEELHFDHSEENIAAKAVVSPEAIARAEAEARLYIRKNIGSHGGGIGTNGDLILKEYDYPDWQINVAKEWDQKISENEKEEVEVFLKIGDQVLDSVKLNRSNDWKGRFTQIPDPSTLHGDITVAEGKMVVENGVNIFKETDSYVVDYEKAVEDRNYTINFKVNNKPAPKISVPVTKTWEGKDGDRVEIYLYADGKR